MQDWLKDGKHLPPFLRDFHDQKEVFKAINETWGSGDISWIDGQCYVIDTFLKWMGAHGYTLQRCRAQQDFVELTTTLEDCDRKRREAFSKMLAEEKLKKAGTDADIYGWEYATNRIIEEEDLK